MSIILLLKEQMVRFLGSQDQSKQLGEKIIQQTQECTHHNDHDQHNSG